MRGRVIIDCFPESVARYKNGYAVVAVDVIRATTTAITAVYTGRRCFPVSSIGSAFERARKLGDAVLAGELRGEMPDRFDLNNSPVQLLTRSDLHRPLVLLSSSGTRLIHEAGSCDAAYLACFRNYGAMGNHLAGRHRRVAVIGAGSRQEFREEDQMCCAWIAESLISAGYQAEDTKTAALVKRWSGVPPHACAEFKSAEYLIKSGQGEDLGFILERINDINGAFMFNENEVKWHTQDGARASCHF